MTRLSLVVALVLAGAAQAQADAGSVADSIPPPGVIGEVLASQLMGVDELSPLRPGTLGDVVSALGAFTKNGALVPGVAAELTPWALGLGTSTTHAQYVNNTALQMLAGSSLSLAAASDPEADAGVRGAVALRFRFMDDSDWRLNGAAIACAKKAYGAPPTPPAVPGLGADGGVVFSPPVSSEVLEQVEGCVTQNVRWNATQLAGGAAFTVRVGGGELARTRADELQALFSAAFGIGEHVQVLATARYAYRLPHVESGADAAVLARHLAGLGGRVVFKMDAFVVNLNLGAGAEAVGGAWYFRGLVGLTLQYRLTDSVWLDASINGNFTGTGPPSALTFGSSLKWSYDFKQLK